MSGPVGVRAMGPSGFLAGCPSWAVAQAWGAEPSRRGRPQEVRGRLRPPRRALAHQTEPPARGRPGKQAMGSAPSEKGTPGASWIRRREVQWPEHREQGGSRLRRNGQEAAAGRAEVSSARPPGRPSHPARGSVLAGGPQPPGRPAQGPARGAAYTHPPCAPPCITAATAVGCVLRFILHFFRRAS